MSRLGDRLQHDLHEIADRSAPSPSAWDAICERLGEPTGEHEPMIETIPTQRADAVRRRHTWVLAAAAALVAILAVGLAMADRLEDGHEPATPPVPTLTTPPTLPTPEFRAIVWQDDTDPARANTTETQPEHVDGPLAARIDMFVATPGPDESQFCADAVDEGSTGPGGEERVLPEIESCFVVRWRFDVGDEAGNNAVMDARTAVTADGDEVEPLVYDFPTAAPGGSASGTVVYPNLGPGSRISLGYQVDLADGGIIFERWDLTVPDALQPIDWFDDAR